MTSILRPQILNPKREAAARPALPVPTTNAKWKPSRYLSALGVHGFGQSEALILASLITEDPLLLIGRSGTGKTFLLNSLSEALGLEHRHYNASLLSFDDLVGFPFPDQDKGSVSFLETPATVWGAQSVLIDEISRCKPEHQNRLFSLVHERRLQGIRLTRLRYRWAAMNPCSADQDGADSYIGSEPLDPALADRFGLIVHALDWPDLSEDERTAIANPAGEGALANDGGRLVERLCAWRALFNEQVNNCPKFIIDYVTAVIGNLAIANIRISPRRARLMSRSLLAAEIATGERSFSLYRDVLEASLPQQAQPEPPPQSAIHAAHQAAWDCARDTRNAWVQEFLLKPELHAKLDLLLNKCPDPDIGSQAIAQLIAVEQPERAAAFAFACYPAALVGRLPVGAEGISDLARIAGPILDVDGTLEWYTPTNSRPEFHRPEDITAVSRALEQLEGAAFERARQFLYQGLLQKWQGPDFIPLVAEIEALVTRLQKVQP